MMHAWIRFLPVISLLLLGGSASSKDLVVDLSSPIVQITSDFAGTDLLLFGAKRGPGDVVVVVRGPWEKQVVRRKERVAGVWVNRTEVAFKEIPSYYWYASNREVGDILPDDVRDIQQIGLDELILTTDDENVDPALAAEFRQALVRNKMRRDLYHDQPASLLFIDDVLFRTHVKFPANVSVGTYGIDVYLVRNQKIVSTETTLLNVRKFGAEAEIYDFAHRQALSYGIVAVLIACAAGWLANAAFRKS